MPDAQRCRSVSFKKCDRCQHWDCCEGCYDKYDDDDELIDEEIADDV